MNKRCLLLFSLAILFATVFLSSFKSKKGIEIPGISVDTVRLPSFAKAKDHRGRSVVNRNNLITFATGFDNDYYPLDSAGRRAFLYLETKMESITNASYKKLPLNISIVIDRSGSMAGEKMEFARKAAMDIIDKLTPDDYVSVIIYDEFIDVIQAASRVLYKDSIKAKIAKIKPRGSTNLWGGSERGYEQVKANYKQNFVNKVLLISDGLITAGVKIPSRILTRVQEYKDIDGITISTFGVGLDYNETLMTGMAEIGAGNYYFIDRADKMASIFDKELNGLLRVLAQNAELRITLPKGVTIENIYPFKYILIKNDLVINFRDLSSEELKALVIQFRLEDNVDKAISIQSKLTYTDVKDNQQKTMVNENILQPVKNRDTYLTHFNKNVAEQVVLFTANENMEKAMLEADRGNFEAARRYAEANGYFFDNNDFYLKGSGELQRMDSMNRYYLDDLAKAKSLGADSLKLMQKSKRALNYQIRSKKQL